MNVKLQPSYSSLVAAVSSTTSTKIEINMDLRKLAEAFRTMIFEALHQPTKG